MVRMNPHHPPHGSSSNSGSNSATTTTTTNHGLGTIISGDKDLMLMSSSSSSSDLVGSGGSGDGSSSLSNSLSSSTSSSATPIALRIKSFRDVEIRVGGAASVSHVKQAVIHALGKEAEDRYLRLICKGRLLAPDTAALSEFSVQNGDVLHAVLAAAGVRGGPQAALSRGTTRRLRGVGIGPGGRAMRGMDSDDELLDDNNDNNNDEEEGRERLGFDRLRASGLSRAEIAAIRTYFSRQVDRFVQQHPTTAQEETDGFRRRLLQEDAWMQTQGPASEFRLNLNQNNPLLRFSVGGGGTGGADAVLFRSAVGTDRDFMWGFLLGFFVGFLMLVWVWMPTVPHKQKLGILAGISVQLALGLLKNREEPASFLLDGE